MRSEVRELRQEIDSKNKELMKKNEELDVKNKELLKKNEELEEAREERNQLMKRLQWKDEELEHERRSKKWTESELNSKVCVRLLLQALYSGTSHNGLSEIQTASIQWTNHVPPNDFTIELIQF